MPKVHELQLTEVTIDILKRLGEKEENAIEAARAMVAADMRGIDTHGTRLLVLIYQRVKEKMLQIPTEIEVINDESATAIINSNNGLGQVAAIYGMRVCIKKAKQFGAGMALIRNTNNVGALGYYTTLAAQEGVAGIMMSNAAPSMAPWGSSEPFIGTNPISIAFPSRGFKPIFIDMSCSIVSRGKIRAAARKGEKIPYGWALNKHGEITTNPEEALEGTLIPLGEYKGSGLSIMIDILTGIISGSGYGKKIETFHKLMGPTGIGSCCMTFDIKKFMDIDTFYSLLQEYITSIKNLKKKEGVSEILLPGEIEWKNESKSIEEGITLPQEIVSDLNKILDKVGSKKRL
jgi:LDH2 family malate/lactate/ureidoglycolate dehydrogenase